MLRTLISENSKKSVSFCKYLSFYLKILDNYSTVTENNDSKVRITTGTSATENQAEKIKVNNLRKTRYPRGN